MTIDPRIGLYFCLISAIGSALVLCGAEFTTLFGSVETARILAGLAIFNVIVNAVNGVLHMIPSKANAANEFPLGPKA
jgi:hypothetical protein